jgi:AcrR family transcriptional regulator
VPTGIALHDARQQLFDAAERVLLRDGPNALTSRSVTAEAGVAKGVLHRYFADFDAFLFELVEDRLARLDGQAVALHESAGTGSVADTVADALITLFRPVAVAIVALVISRDGLRARLRQAGASRVPLLTEGTAMIASYLNIESELGRVAANADIDTLSYMLIGTAQLLFADREGPQPDFGAVHKVVAAILANAVPDLRRSST